MVDYRKFSLNGEKVTIQRFSGGYNADGVYERTMTETFETYGSMQPYKTIAPTDIFMPNRGVNVEQRVILFLNEKLYIDDSTQTNATADQVLVDDRIYIPVSKENWNYAGSRSSHYRYVMRLFDGY